LVLCVANPRYELVDRGYHLSHPQVVFVLFLKISERHTILSNARIDQHIERLYERLVSDFQAGLILPRRKSDSRLMSHVPHESINTHLFCWPRRWTTEAPAGCGIRIFGLRLRSSTSNAWHTSASCTTTSSRLRPIAVVRIDERSLAV